jgi:hypothetical protein
VVGAINKAFVSVAQPFGGFLKLVAKIVEEKRG